MQVHWPNYNSRKIFASFRFSQGCSWGLCSSELRHCTTGRLVPYFSRQHAELFVPWRWNHHSFKMLGTNHPAIQGYTPKWQRFQNIYFLGLITVASLLTILQRCHVFVLLGFTTSCDSNTLQQHSCFVYICSCSIDMIYITEYIWYQYKAMRVQPVSVKLENHEEFLHLCHSNSSSAP